MESAPVDFRTSQQEITVLKKAGIIVATTAAGLFALAPLAFADGGDKGGNFDPNATSFEVNDNSCNGSQTNTATASSPALVDLLSGIAANVLNINALNCTDILN